MADAPPSPSHGDDTPHTRWTFVCDVLLLQWKLLLGNLHNFILIPATLAAAILDLVIKSGPHGHRFYRVLAWGRRAEEAIDLYSALDRFDGPNGEARAGVAFKAEMPTDSPTDFADGPR